MDVLDTNKYLNKEGLAKVWGLVKQYVWDESPIAKGNVDNSAVLKESENNVNGKFSIALGYGNNISGNSSAAFGYNNIVENNCCTTEGSNNKVCGDNSHVEGRECIVEGHESHAEGNYTKVHGHCSHGEGTSCRVLGDNSHVEGLSSVVYGHISHAEGQFCAAGDLDQVDKISDERTDYGCHAEGIRTTAKEMASHSEGIDTHSMGIASHTEGRGSYASGDASHAEGLNTKSGVKGFYFKGIDIKNKKIYLSTTKPDAIKTSGFASSDFENIDFPYDIDADMLSIINGNIYYDCLKVTQIKNKSVIYVESLPFTSVAEFNELFKNSNYTIFCLSKYKLGAVSVTFGCHAEGYETRSFGLGSHTDGYNTIAKNVGEHASGIYNVSNGDTQFSIGIGTSDADRKNAHEITTDGKHYIYGIGGYDGTNPSTSDDIATVISNLEGADWNAKESEAGHIENKPFYSIVDDYNVMDVETSSFDDEYGTRYTYSVECEGNYSGPYIWYKDFYGDNFIDISNYNDGDSIEILIYDDVNLVGSNYYFEFEKQEFTNEYAQVCRYILHTCDEYVPTIIYDYSVKQINDIYIPYTIARISDLENINVGQLVKISYSDLKSLKINSKLVPGQQYHITDYVTTTTQENTQSAGHQFDIIITADDVNVLNEDARAIQHTTDENDYFHNSDLAAWEIKYCLDNDTDRFAWVDDSDNGRGVIYYMKDEFNNECPYDFKNIQFARWELSNPVGYRNDYDNENENWIQESTPFDSLKTGFYGLKDSANVFYYGYNKYMVEYTISESPTYCYTFGNGTDYSISGSDYGNVIKEYKKNNKIQLNNIVFLSNNCYSNNFGNNCYDNSLGNNCYFNSFSDDCSSNNFGNDCHYNRFGNYCDSNSFGESCNNNNFGNSCYFNNFGNSCSSNNFGNSCYFNNFGNSCYSNSFGNSCDNNSFSDDCSSNSFGNDCNNNSFSEGCHYNSFGEGCYSNSFSNICYSNSFGNSCYSNNFGNSCQYNTFDHGCNNNTFGESCNNNTFGTECTKNLFSNNCLRNVFGNACKNNIFGNGCNDNNLGNSCIYIIFGGFCRSNILNNNCIYISFGESSDSLKSYYRYITIDSGNRYIYLNCTSTTTSSEYYQNIRIGLGVNNTSTYKTINDTNVGQTYETYYKPANSQTITI